jgi:hypothetical protein
MRDVMRRFQSNFRRVAPGKIISAICDRPGPGGTEGAPGHRLLTVSDLVREKTSQR